MSTFSQRHGFEQPDPPITIRDESPDWLRDLVVNLATKAHLTGAIQHAMAALECVARDVTGDQNATLGELIKRNPGLLPAPLDKGVEKIWGFASDQARHVREGKPLDIRDAELVVGLAGSLATYLVKKSQSGTSS